MAKRKSAKNTLTTANPGCMARLQKYGRYGVMIFGACCIVSFMMSLLAPSKDESAVPTLRVIPTVTATTISDTPVPTATLIPDTVVPTVNTVGTEAFQATIQAADSRASETAVSRTKVASLPSQTPLPTTTIIPTAQAQIAQVIPTVDTSAVEPNIRRTFAVMDEVDAIQSIEVFGEDVKSFQLELIAYPGYDVAFIQTMFEITVVDAVDYRDIGELILIISDGREIIAYRKESLDSDWVARVIPSTNPPTPQPIASPTNAMYFPTALPEVARLEDWLEQQAGVDVVLIASVRGQPLSFYAEVIVYPGYNTLAFAEGFYAASQQLANGRAIDNVTIIISDGESAIAYVNSQFGDGWELIPQTSVDAPTPRPNNQATATDVPEINRTGGTTRYASTGDVRVRTCPRGGADGCEVIAVLLTGDSIMTYETVEGSDFQGSTLWYEAVYNGRDGYVHTRLVQSSSPVTAVQPVTNTSSSGAGVQTNNVRPANCDEAVAMGLTAQQAAQWDHLDRDNDGVACYGD